MSIPIAPPNFGSAQLTPQMLSATLRLFSSRQLLSTSSRMASADPHSIYQFTVKDADGKDVNLGDKYK